MSEAEIVERLLTVNSETFPYANSVVLGYCKEAAAEIERLRALMEWKPIETAPKDGTRIIALVDGSQRIVAWTKTSHVPLYGWCLVDQGAEDCELCSPTYWMPLPDDPKEKNDG